MSVVTGQIPSPIAEIYEALSKEVTWPHGRWICFRQLFGESERRISMLNECASTFFFIVQDVLMDEVQICLSKLTDPARIGKHDNLSLEQLQLRLQQHGDATLAAKNRLKLDEMQNQVVPFREWRNKQLAHLDLLTAIKVGASPLPGVSRQMIEDALLSLRTYLNAVELHYKNSEIGYEHFIMNSDGEALLATLRAGLRYEELVQEGKISFGDWRNGKWHDA